MQQVQLTDGLYEQVRQRARGAGFESVDAYVADLLRDDLAGPDDFQHLFTPERLAIADAAAADIANGNFLTPEQLEARLAEVRTQCLREDPH